MNITNYQPVTVPLRKEAHHFARLFAAEQINVEKGKQVYFNTLAVYAVHSYLKWLQIPSDLDAGESWHPIHRITGNVADLVVPGYGVLECCPILPNHQDFTISSECLNRTAYIAVQFKDTLNEVDLLGFYSSVDPNKLSTHTIRLDQLLPIDDLGDRLLLMGDMIAFLESDNPLVATLKELIDDEETKPELLTSIDLVREERKNRQFNALKSQLNRLFSEKEKSVLQTTREVLVRKVDEVNDEEVEEQFDEFVEELLTEFQQIWREE